ncbi:hypothetical protein KSP40_PGU019618 [Platanthera guangdongensis]|uniref:Uncharacterized protein n=1 Tax=Platanthera guangdongensis TaxID=2320717 RepID=A0ABR2N072_9ASPA
MVEHVRREDNVTNIFTKPLSKGLFIRLRGLLGLVSTSHFMLGKRASNPDQYTCCNSSKRNTKQTAESNKNTQRIFTWKTQLGRKTTGRSESNPESLH